MRALPGWTGDLVAGRVVQGAAGGICALVFAIVRDRHRSPGIMSAAEARGLLSAQAGLPFAGRGGYVWAIGQATRAVNHQQGAGRHESFLQSPRHPRGQGKQGA